MTSISKELIKQVFIEQRDNLLKKNFGIPRNVLKQVGQKLPLPHVIVIKGIRRSGKSTLLRQIIKQYYHDKDFYYINFEDERLRQIDPGLFSTLLEIQHEIFGDTKTFFIDEIQQCQGFEQFVRRLTDEGYKFIITGSNATLLSGEISSKLTGRHVDITVHPFSFSEFLKLQNIPLDAQDFYKSDTRAVLKRNFNDYLFTGGMPEYLIFQDNEIINRIYEDIILKDIAIRHGISFIKAMRELYQYILSNACKPFSYRTLTKITSIDSPVTIKNYLHYLEQSFLITIINKYDHSLKKQLINNKKIFVIDNAFIHKLSFSVTDNKGWLLENLVGIELAKNNELFYFSGKAECDFISKIKNKCQPVQVCYEISDDNRKRETDGLKEAMDFFNEKESMIITYDDEDEIKLDNRVIHIVPAWKWVLSGTENL